MLYLLHILEFLTDHYYFNLILTILIFYPIFEFIFDKFKFSNKNWMYYWQLFSFIILFLILIVIIVITYLSFNPAYCSDNPDDKHPHTQIFEAVKDRAVDFSGNLWDGMSATGAMTAVNKGLPAATPSIARVGYTALAAGAGVVSKHSAKESARMIKDFIKSSDSSSGSDNSSNSNDNSGSTSSTGASIESNINYGSTANTGSDTGTGANSMNPKDIIIETNNEPLLSSPLDSSNVLEGTNNIDFNLDISIISFDPQTSFWILSPQELNIFSFKTLYSLLTSSNGVEVILSSILFLNITILILVFFLIITLIQLHIVSRSCSAELHFLTKILSENSILKIKKGLNRIGGFSKKSLILNIIIIIPVIIYCDIMSISLMTDYINYLENFSAYYIEFTKNK
jgi:hypothetical protein